MIASRRLGILGGMFDPIHDGHLDTGAAAERALNLTGLLFVPSNIPPHRPQPEATSFHRFAMVAMAIAGHSGWRALDLELRQPIHSYTADTLRYLHAAGFLPRELFFVVGADAFLEIATWKDYPALLDLAHFAVVARARVKVSELPARLPALASRMRTPDGPGSPPDPTHDQFAGRLTPDPTHDQSSGRLTPDSTHDQSAVRPKSDTTHDQSTGRPKSHTTHDQSTVRRKPVHTADQSIVTDARIEQSDIADNDGTFIFLIDATTADVSSTAIREARRDRRTIAQMVPPSVLQHIEQHALYEASAPTAGGDPSVLRTQAGRLHGQD